MDHFKTPLWVETFSKWKHLYSAEKSNDVHFTSSSNINIFYIALLLLSTVTGLHSATSRLTSTNRLFHNKYGYGHFFLKLVLLSMWLCRSWSNGRNHVKVGVDMLINKSSYYGFISVHLTESSLNMFEYNVHHQRQASVRSWRKFGWVEPLIFIDEKKTECLINYPAKVHSHFNSSEVPNRLLSFSTEINRVLPCLASKICPRSSIHRSLSTNLQITNQPKTTPYKETKMPKPNIFYHILFI